MSTRSALLRHAETLMRTRGYAAFSFADLAEHVAIRKASVHHHFPSKEELGRALVQDYRQGFEKQLHAIEAEHDSAPARLRAFGHVFAASCEAGMLPLCCALAGERAALPESLREAVRDFFQMHLRWLTRIVAAGQEAGELAHPAPAAQVALTLLSLLEGGSLVGWALQERAPVLHGFESALHDMERVVAPGREAP
ncbi:TetR/AcrR family transcriptional regulator [Roseomonas sp. E05]|uniref:TetR/AcrR family transcriptional regulator n=1 Tax=Roseomonas sp. E05 TaxID=3046310 RepID=UPI0024B965BA|nr:TetR/AcrR family transcriptional regulator [Roseomonas sp. E05]MDJ0389034.1 TetR/AcrR family transcriptional regulator [Roseomonas sp. E05]